MRLFVLGRLFAAIVAVVALAASAMATPAVAQQTATPVVATPVGEFCGHEPPNSFTCKQEVCVTACLTPEEWGVCPTKSWWADSKDHKLRAPQQGKFYERCGTVCRPPGTPNLAYLTSGEATNGERRWVVFRFPPKPVQ